MRPDVEIERFAARHAPSLTAGSWVMQTEHSAPDSDRFRAMELTKTFAPEAYSSALESWSWLDIATKVPVLATLFGDVFFQDAGGYWFLDTIEGSLGRPRWVGYGDWRGGRAQVCARRLSCLHRSPRRRQIARAHRRTRREVRGCQRRAGTRPKSR